MADRNADRVLFWPIVLTIAWSAGLIFIARAPDHLKNDKAAATERYAVDREAIIDAAFEQARIEAQTREPLIVAELDEVEFDHVPSEAELDAAFPNRRKAAATI